jgi:SNF family Na+-dependent transporter
MSAASSRQWSSQLGFLAAAIGTAVGIANVWKFT